MITYFVLISWIFILLYIFLILRIYYGWALSIKDFSLESLEKSKVSIVIAIRNEAKNLPELIDSLALQNYPKTQFEILLIDDHSEDQSASIVQNKIIQYSDLQLYYIQLGDDKTGKKSALQKAYSLAQNDIILTTDGDCELPKDWIKLSAKAFQNPNIQMILGGVFISEPKDFLEIFQSLELHSLIGSGAGAVQLKHPIMSNGANLAFRKKALKMVDLEKALNTKQASGDDMFLLSEFKRIFGSSSIHFIKNVNHFVKTKAVDTWKDYLNQRIRWVSKSGSYKDSSLIASSFIVLLGNLFILVLLFASFFLPQLFQTLLNVFVLKMISDFIFLRNICRFTNQSYLLKHYPIIAIIYPFFIVYTAIAGQFKNYQWKGRNY